MLLGLGLLSSSRGSTAEPSVVPPHVMQAASARGSVRVIVHLNDAGLAPEAALAGPAAIAGQRQTIGLMQRSLRQGLRGTSHRVLRQYETLPFVALHVTPDDLGGPKVHGASGVADITANDEVGALRTAQRLLSYLPDSNRVAPPFERTSDPIDRPTKEIDALLKAGASRTAKDSEGHTPADLALNHDPEIIKLLKVSK